MSLLDKAEDIDFVTKTAIERDPKKRRVKPIETQASILDFDLGESSDDSDFRIEDHPEVSDDDSLDTNDDDKSSSEQEEEESEESEEELKNLNVSSNGLSVTDILEHANVQKNKNLQFDSSQILICCGCLGDQSDSVNEIVECDSCGATVHEACYGISDNVSTSSSDSLSPTAPWFCEACRAGVQDPVCELCPNSGGVFKETDVGKWVHLVCALYIPGVAFGEVDKLSSVTLFEMPYSKWGARTCGICPDDRYSRTGVCIGCDAGMCRTYFHVTCAQREGLLSEAHSEEADQADPFYAHCKMHSDKALVSKRKRNYLALQQRNHFRKIQLQKSIEENGPEQQRILRKLAQQKSRYFNLKSLKTPPWVPTQKMPRLLTTSSSACKKLLRKAELMEIDIPYLEKQEKHLLALTDVRKKWHIPPAFSVEFIAYYLDRNDRLESLKAGLEKLLEENSVLLEEQKVLRAKYDQLMQESSEELKRNAKLKQTIHKFHSAILSACPTKNLPNIDELGKPLQARAPQQMMVPTAAALKMGVGFPLTGIGSNNRNDSGRVLSIPVKHQQTQDPIPLNECGICNQQVDQHLLAKCDTCSLYYHLSCLNPPLTRLPKKSKLYGWQCSECDKTSDSEVEQVKLPRRSRNLNGKDYKDLNKNDAETYTPKVKIKLVEEPQISVVPVTNFVSTNSFELNNAKQKTEAENETRSDSLTSKDPLSCGVPDEEVFVITSKSGKKRRREKHRSRYSPTLEGSSKEHKRKRKKKSIDNDEEAPNPHPRITIKIRPIPLPAGQTVSSSNPQRFYVPDENSPPIQPPPKPVCVPALPATNDLKKPSASTKNKQIQPPNDTCDVCKENGNNSNLVSCDECQKCYHFACLEPPLKKSPKKRGYSWHCEDCDPTVCS